MSISSDSPQLCEHFLALGVFSTRMEIINRVAQSALLTFKLEDYYPAGERVLLDIKDQLFMGLILREKDFRTYIAETDWAQYTGKYVAITCSADAIVPTWAYMLLAAALEPYAATYTFGSIEELDRALVSAALDTVDFTQFQDKPVVIKGCADVPMPTAMYVEVMKRLLPYAKKLSFGEPCSTVPLWKRA